MSMDLLRKTQRRLQIWLLQRDVSLLTTAHEQGSRKSPDPVASCRIMFGKEYGISQLFMASILGKLQSILGLVSSRMERISNIDWNCSIIANLKELRKLGRPSVRGNIEETFHRTIAWQGRSSGQVEWLSGRHRSFGLQRGTHDSNTRCVAHSGSSRIAYAVREKGLIHNN